MIGCVLAYKTRNLDPRFGEAKQLGFAMYNIAFTGIIIITISGVVPMDQVNKKMLQTVGVLWGTLFCSSAFVVPRLFEVTKRKKPGTHANRVWKNEGRAQVLVSASAERSSRGIDDSSTFTTELQESPRLKRESLEQPSGFIDKLPDLMEDSKESFQS